MSISSAPISSHPIGAGASSLVTFAFRTIEEKIEAALFARVDLLSLVGDPPVALPNVPFPDPSTGDDKPDTFVEVRLFFNKNTRLFLRGTDPHLRQGILQFTVFTPRDGGYTLATKLAGEIALHFPADLILTEDDVRVRIRNAPDVVGAEETEDKVSWSGRVDVSYECFK